MKTNKYFIRLDDLAPEPTAVQVVRAAVRKYGAAKIAGLKVLFLDDKGCEHVAGVCSDWLVPQPKYDPVGHVALRNTTGCLAINPFKVVRNYARNRVYLVKNKPED